jgi:hypothetical protein
MWWATKKIVNDEPAAAHSFAQQQGCFLPCSDTRFYSFLQEEEEHFVSQADRKGRWGMMANEALSDATE